MKRTRTAKRPPAAQARTKAPREWPVNLDDFEAAAARLVDPMAYAYVAGGAADELTLRRNRDAFAAIRLRPRVLVDVSRIDTRISLFGQALDFPILLAPTAYHRLVHPEGELATARGASAAGATLVVSTAATCPIEEIVARTSSPVWFQLYVNRDRGFTRDLLGRAEAAGCRAFCLTVDSPVFGVRNREGRAHFRLPKGIAAVHLEPLGSGPQKTGHVADDGVYSPLMDPSLHWRDIDWLCSIVKAPVILKGILTPEDALLAMEHGASGIAVSNHGGRNLDTVPASIEALPGVVNAVAGRVPVLFDGGIRRGTDALKALALGADAVMIGRPYLWGLAVGGADGVAEVVRILRNELLSAMALCGLPEIARISRDVLWPAS